MSVAHVERQRLASAKALRIPRGGNMRPELVQAETLVEFFHRLVLQALARQQVRVLDLTRYYLVQLLASRARISDTHTGAGRGDEPLALRYARAIESAGSRQRAELRGLADDALFVSGFFSDSLARRVVDMDYYASLGGHAYQHLSALDTDTLAPTFAELAQRFLACAEVLAEVSEQSSLTSDTDLLRLYERWVFHGSSRNTERLIRRGIAPVPQARLRIQ
jgi:hypothetical protein